MKFSQAETGRQTDRQGGGDHNNVWVGSPRRCVLGVGSDAHPHSSVDPKY